MLFTVFLTFFCKVFLGGIYGQFGIHLNKKINRLTISFDVFVIGRHKKNLKCKICWQKEPTETDANFAIISKNYKIKSLKQYKFYQTDLSSNLTTCVNLNLWLDLGDQYIKKNFCIFFKFHQFKFYKIYLPVSKNAS